MATTHVAREQGSCSHGCAPSGPESGVQNIRDTITNLTVGRPATRGVKSHVVRVVVPLRHRRRPPRGHCGRSRDHAMEPPTVDRDCLRQPHYSMSQYLQALSHLLGRWAAPPPRGATARAKTRGSGPRGSAGPAASRTCPPPASSTPPRHTR